MQRNLVLRRQVVPLIKLAAGILLALCLCGGLATKASGQEPTEEPTETATTAPTEQPASTPTPTPTRSPTPTATPTSTATPPPTNTPPATSTPLPLLPPAGLLQFLTPTASETPLPTATPEPAPTEAATPLPPAAPYEPSREPVRAEVADTGEPGKGPIGTDVTPAPPAADVEVTPTRQPDAMLKPVTPVSGKTPQPPLSLTPAGIAPGGPGATTTGVSQGTLISIGALLLAAGGSWGAYYFLRPPTD